MEFKQIISKALEIRSKYAEFEKKKWGKEWTRQQIVQALVTDIGDLMERVMVKEGLREMENIDEKLSHKLADCLWVILVFADKYGVDLESSFLKNMDLLDERIKKSI